MPVGFYGLKEDMPLTMKQILLMERAMGYSLHKVRKRAQRISGTHHDNGADEDSDWEYLCAIGYAARMKAFGHCVYRVTSKGMEVISAITGVRFMLPDDAVIGGEK